MPASLKQIALKLTPELLGRIDEAAQAQGLDRSSFIRSACVAAIEGQAPSPSQDNELLSSLKVADERSKAVIRDVLQRLNRLEAHCFSSDADPFSD